MTQTENKPHKNIRGKEYFAQAIKDNSENQLPQQTPILRLRDFVQWAKSKGLCESERDFERQCCLSSNYIGNNIGNGKGNIGTEMLGRIVKVYPQLNLAWICTGNGDMVLSDHAVNMDYKQAYEGAMMQVEALNRIIKQLNK